MKRSQRGGTLVEAALTLPVFLLFIFAILEFGRAYNIYQVMTNAAREGARFAVAPCPLNPSTCIYGPGVLPTTVDIQAKVNSYLSSSNVNGATVTINQTFGGSVNGIPTVFTKVNIAAPYSFFILPYASVTMTTQAVMRNENN